MNLTILQGALSSVPRRTELPSGAVVVNYEVTTDEPESQRRSVPVAWHDPARPSRLTAGDQVVVVGAVRRRWFRSGGATMSRTEVVATVVAPAGSARARRALVAAADAAATAVVGE